MPSNKILVVLRVLISVDHPVHVYMDALWLLPCDCNCFDKPAVLNANLCKFM